MISNMELKQTAGYYKVKLFLRNKKMLKKQENLFKQCSDFRNKQYE